MYSMLIVDDNTVERTGIAALVNKLSLPIETFEASNGKQALALLETSHFDILFTDIRMPIMDGLELIERAKALFPELSCIIFSAYSDFEYARRAINSGTSSYMLKPINVSDFLKTMESVISTLDYNAMLRNEEKAIVENMISFNSQSGEIAAATVSLCINKVFDAIAGKDFSSLPDLISEMFTAMQEYNVASMLYVKQIVIEMLKKMCEYLRSDDKKDIISTIHSIALCDSIKDIQSFALSTTEKIGELVTAPENDARPVSYIIDLALKYISEHYSSDISLEQIAHELNISTGYLSRSFKKEVGLSFVKHLTAFRMEKAKKLLTQTTMKIKEIGVSVGIPDISYFGYIFKKYTEYTPDEYRKKYR